MFGFTQISEPNSKFVSDLLNSCKYIQGIQEYKLFLWTNLHNFIINHENQNVYFCTYKNNHDFFEKYLKCCLSLTVEKISGAATCEEKSEFHKFPLDKVQVCLKHFSESPEI